jgi:hypothetical protein
MITIRNAVLGFFALTLFSYTVTFAELSATITLNPENPEPNSPVTLTLESYAFNTSVANITWKVGGKVVASGEGVDTLKLTTGDVGQALPVSVRAETADGEFIEQAIAVVPSSVILLYEAPKSYVPFFYEGRSLPSDGGTVHVSAFPQMSDGGGILDPSTLSYSWYVDGELVKYASGLGRQSADLRLDILQDSDEIKVMVQSPRGNSTTKTITISPHPVMPLLYLYDPVFGPDFTKLVGKRFETVTDFILDMEPFYVSYRESRAPTYNWYLGGLPSTPTGGRVLSLQPKANSYGSKILQIKVEGPNKIVQEGEVSTEFVFDTRK